MARPRAPRTAKRSRTRGGVYRNAPSAVTGSAAVFRPRSMKMPNSQRSQIAKAWQIEAYRQVVICGEARYAVSLFASIASRAELGISEPQTLANRSKWINEGPEVDVLAEIMPNVRDRAKFLRDYMHHWTIAGEMYLVARDRVDSDPGYGVLNNPLWELVAVTELQRVGNGEGSFWRVRHENGNYLDLVKNEPVIRIWNPDPENRMEAWSPIRSMLATLREIEWMTKSIFTQIRSRMATGGVWFLPNNMTFPPPPPEAVEGGAARIALMNEAELFMASLASAGMELLDSEEVAFPSVVTVDAEVLANIDQSKLINFWSKVDDTTMLLRADAIRRFALGMDLPAEALLGSSGVAVTGSAGSAGSGASHWGEWAIEEKSIAYHAAPAVETLCQTLTYVVQLAVGRTDKIVGMETDSMRMKQDKSKEALEWYDRGIMSKEAALRTARFDPETDMMSPEEHKQWLLGKLVSGTPSPEQMQAAFLLLTGEKLPVETFETGEQSKPRGQSGQQEAPNLDDHPHQGPPQGDHYHRPAPYSTRTPDVGIQSV